MIDKNRKLNAKRVWKSIGRTTIDMGQFEIGTEWIGTYLGSSDITSEYGTNQIWKFRDEEGKPFSFFGFGSINFQMESVPIGALCRVTWRGRSKTKGKFGKYPKQVLVEISENGSTPKTKAEDSVKDEEEEQEETTVKKARGRPKKKTDEDDELE